MRGGSIEHYDLSQTCRDLAAPTNVEEVDPEF